MSTYYCRQCASNRAIKSDLSPNTDFTGSFGSYMHQKFEKHTEVPPTGSKFVSIFDTAEYDQYKDYIVNAHASGSVEYDDHGRENILLFANKPVGKIFNDGVYHGEANGIKVVLHEDISKVHAYPCSSGELEGMICEDCGTSIYVEVEL